MKERARRDNFENRKAKASSDRNIENESIEFFKKNVLRLNELRDQYDIFCDHAKAYAEKLKEGGVSTSKIRRLYARILNAAEVMDIKLLRPHFAYISGRNEDSAVLKKFMDLLDYLAKEMDINNRQHLDNFKQFMKDVAYRKYVVR